MVSSDFRREARTKLSGKWGKAALITLIYIAVFLVIELIYRIVPDSLQLILDIAVLVIQVPLMFGLAFSLFKLFNNEDVKAFDLFSLGFNNFKKSWGIMLRTILKILVPFILFVVSSVVMVFSSTATVTSLILGGSGGFFSAITIIAFIVFMVSLIWAIVKAYYYVLANYIAFDNLELSSKDAVEKSRELMNQKRAKFFCLQFSFIGWAILAVFTLGIGYLWLLPYMQFATIAFYKFVAGKTETVTPEIEA